MRTEGEKREYQRGYVRGMRREWPHMVVVTPDDPAVKQLMLAAGRLRNAVSNELSGLCSDDPWQTALGDPCDAVTAAIRAIHDRAAELITNAPAPGQEGGDGE